MMAADEKGERPQDGQGLLLHISSDYLDPIRPPPITDAVRRLVDRMTDHPQIVVSLQRVSDLRRGFWRDFGMIEGRRLIVHAYFAPPFGVAMFFCQMLVARRIRRFLATEDLKPRAIHAHRFTFEGIAAWLLARKLSVPLFFSVRGEVEGKVFSAKPTYRPLFRKMARDATRLYLVSAWFRARFERHTGVAASRMRLLPNIVHNARRSIPSVEPYPRIVIAMSLRAIDKKGLPELLQAFALAGDALGAVTLEIVGDGPIEDQARVRALIERNGLTGRAFLHPFMPNETLLDYFAHSLGLAMPSHNETFGMVYAEALFAGAPILYSTGTGIDGYLDGLPAGLAFGVAVEPGNVDDIAAGLIRLVRENGVLRAAIRDNAGLLCERLHPDEVVARYRTDIAQAMVAS